VCISLTLGICSLKKKIKRRKKNERKKKEDEQGTFGWEILRKKK
jgi:hypothetical protein